jgi:DNA-binding CsgD family transcriptional regulator/undecaprenyl pyrophosphate phosphatase UppP
MAACGGFVFWQQYLARGGLRKTNGSILLPESKNGENGRKAASQNTSRTSVFLQLGTSLKATVLLSPAGFICASSLGLSFNDPRFEGYLRSPWYFLAAMLLVAVFLLALLRIWRNRDKSTAETLLLAMVVPSLCCILALVMDGFLDESLTYLLLLSSNLSYLALLWLGLLHNGSQRESFSSMLPMTVTLLLIAVFALCVALAPGLPTSAILIFARVVAFTYLVLLVVFGFRAIRRNTSTQHVPFSRIKKESVERMSADYRLSPRESDVLHLLVSGLSAVAVGKQLFLSPETIKTHRSHIYDKLAVHSQAELIAIFERYTEDENK